MHQEDKYKDLKKENFEISSTSDFFIILCKIDK